MSIPARLAEGTHADLCARFAGELDAIVEEHLRRTGLDAPGFFELPAAFIAEGTRICRESIRVESGHLAADASLPDVCPEVDLEYARVCVELELPVAEMVRAYHRSHAIQWETWQRIVEDAELPEDERLRFSLIGSRFFFAYADRLALWTFAAYTAGRDAVLESSAQRRTNLVRDVLQGRPVDPAALGYDLAARHIGVVARGDGAERAVHALATATGRTALLVEAAAGVWWGWLGGGVPLSGLRPPVPPTGASLAIGRDAVGLQGFRHTHEQALQAQRATMGTDATVTTYDDVALEALLARDPDAAWAFVREELGALAGDDERTATLRETLRAWFATGHNAAAAAARLKVHEQTVAARLRTVEERIGRPPHARRAELEAALRLLRFLTHDINEPRS